MNYKRIYRELIESRRERGVKKQVGYEVHHIIPRCMGGSDTADNLVKLSYREHYIAHWLLVKMHPTHSGIQYGFLCLLRDPHGTRPLTSRMFATIKRNYSNFRKWHSKIHNPGKTPQSRAAARLRMNSDRNPMRGRPEINPTAYPHKVTFDDGSERIYSYGKLGYIDIGMSRSSWITAVRYGIPVPKYKVRKIEKYENNNTKSAKG